MVVAHDVRLILKKARRPQRSEKCLRALKKRADHRRYDKAVDTACELLAEVCNGARMEDVFEFRKDDYRIQPLRQRVERSKLGKEHQPTKRSMRDVTADRPFEI
jgi:hypothetical protein